MDDNSDPIRPDEIDRLFARFASFGPCALAVSGGSDSTALMVLFADWLRQRGQDTGRCTVLTVDHGLRASSAAEARAVAAAAVQLGYRHATLHWEGTKPQAGIQAAARAARYRLLGDYMRAHGLALLLTAHTRDDQAETLLMRLARGSGLDGLCAMAPLSPLMSPPGDRGRAEAGADGAGVRWIGRPFLDVPKSCLRATLEARRIRWMEDPSNIAPEFERVRLRAAGAELHALGLTPAMLALSAARLARARRAVEAVVDRFCDPHAGAVRVDACGAITVERGRLRQAGEEIAVRVLDRAIAAAGGAAERTPLSKVEAVLRAVYDPGAAASGRWTLARAVISAAPASVQIEREPGREPPPDLVLAAGATALWDGRFRVTVSPQFAGTVEVRPLGEAGLRDLRREVRAQSAPVRAAAMAPSIWLKGRLIAVPALHYWAPPHVSGDVAAHFVGLGAAAPREWPSL